MLLENSFEKKIKNPTEQDINDMFLGFGENDMDDFVILSKNNMHYIQTAIGEKEEEGFILEFQDGSLDKHFIATDRDLELEKIIEIFIAFNKGDENWKSDFEWELSVIDESDF
jgi:hypothetical protein